MTKRTAPLDRFAQPAEEAPTWDGLYSEAERERTAMNREFRAWLIKARIETEQHLLARQKKQREYAPFAAAGISQAPSPRDVPMLVLEFAQVSLDVLRYACDLRLFNTFYQEAAANLQDDGFRVAPEHEAEFQDLWDTFMAERPD